MVIAGDYNIALLKVKQKTIFNLYLDTLISLSFFLKITLPTRLSNKRGTDRFHYFLCLDSSPYTNKNPQYVKVKTRGPDAII